MSDQKEEKEKTPEEIALEEKQKELQRLAL